MSQVSYKAPESYDHNVSEPRWAQRWEEAGIYRWDPEQPRERTFVVDTPPPTVSGSLHVGHVFSYTQTDVIVRYQRIRFFDTREEADNFFRRVQPGHTLILSDYGQAVKRSR